MDMQTEINEKQDQIKPLIIDETFDKLNIKLLFNGVLNLKAWELLETRTPKEVYDIVGHKIPKFKLKYWKKEITAGKANPFKKHIKYPRMESELFQWYKDKINTNSYLFLYFLYLIILQTKIMYKKNL